MKRKKKCKMADGGQVKKKNSFLKQYVSKRYNEAHEQKTVKYPGMPRIKPKKK